MRIKFLVHTLSLCSRCQQTIYLIVPNASLTEPSRMDHNNRAKPSDLATAETIPENSIYHLYYCLAACIYI